jgi:hypothetical protein
VLIGKKQPSAGEDIAEVGVLEEEKGEVLVKDFQEVGGGVKVSFSSFFFLL